MRLSDRICLLKQRLGLQVKQLAQFLRLQSRTASRNIKFVYRYWSQARQQFDTEKILCKNLLCLSPIGKRDYFVGIHICKRQAASNCDFAGVAQRQSNGFVNRRLRVRFPSPAYGWMSEWLKETGCKLVSESLRWFESSSTQTFVLSVKAQKTESGNRSNLFTGSCLNQKKPIKIFQE